MVGSFPGYNVFIAGVRVLVHTWAVVEEGLFSSRSTTERWSFFLILLWNVFYFVFKYPSDDTASPPASVKLQRLTPTCYCQNADTDKWNLSFSFWNFLTFIFSDVVNFSSWINGFLPSLEGRIFDEFIVGKTELTPPERKINKSAPNVP